MTLRVGDYARCTVPLLKPGRWTRQTNVRTGEIAGITGQYVQIKVPNRKGTVAIRRSDVLEFWRSEGGVLRNSRNDLKPQSPKDGL